jgi:hypothetical protein
MTCSDEDHDRSRRPGVEDQVWSHRSGLGDWTIKRSDDAVCGLHCAHGDEECRFLG